MTSPASLRAPGRVIPRPSERRPPTATPVASTSPGHLARIDGPEPKYMWVAGLGSGFAAIGFGTLGLLDRAPTTAGLVLVPAFAGLAHLALVRRVQPGVGAGFTAIAMAGLALRFLSSVPRLVAAADAELYQREGERLAASFRQFDFFVSTGRAIPGTGSLRYLSGLINLATGSSYVATYLVFVLIAFVGQVLFLLGVRRVLTDRQFRLATLLVMLWPSMAYWPSSIGKEAAVIFGIGVATLGLARLYDREYRGLLTVALGLLAVGMVRPHVSLIILVALVVGLFAWRVGQRSRVVLHVVAVAVALAASMWLTDVTATLFDLEQLGAVGDLSAALDFAQNRTSQDSARFIAPRADSITSFPWAAVTVLFRPFPWEAPNALAVLSAVEGLALAGLLLAAAPGLIGERAKFLTRGLLLHAVVFSAVFVFLFSALGNFGILTRQRVQLLPFVLVFVAIGLGFERTGRQQSPEVRR